jgi:hypothetical protein
MTYRVETYRRRSTYPAEGVSVSACAIGPNGRCIVHLVVCPTDHRFSCDPRSVIGRFAFRALRAAAWRTAFTRVPLSEDSFA